MKLHRLILFVLLLPIAATRAAQEFISGPDRTDLIELFTSEGCSSCPPADREMNALFDNKDLWTGFVPVAFHVDYWNYLGWPDPYSSADYSARQRRYTSEWRTRSTYTPCFAVNGKAARNPLAKGDENSPGTLMAKLENNQASITFEPTQVKGDLVAWIAPLSGKVSTKVKAGENRGRTLEHCFVALGLSSGKMSATGNTYSAMLTLPSAPGTQAIAVWVSRADALRPLQATGGWLKNP